MAQAARLAEGLGDKRQAEDLRKKGLKSGDKVSPLDKRDGGEKLRRKDEGMGSRDADRGSKKEKKDGDRKDYERKAKRRHSFDSVVDYKPSFRPSNDSTRYPEQSSTCKADKSSRSCARKDKSCRSPVDKPADYRYSTGRPRDTIDRYVAGDSSSKTAGKGKERAISFDFDDFM